MNRMLLAPPSMIMTGSSSPDHSSPLTDLDEDSFPDDIPPLNLGSNILEEDLIIIDTQFDPEDPLNKRPPFQDRDPYFILEWTKKERKKAERAVVVENVHDLKSRVSKLSFRDINY